MADTLNMPKAKSDEIADAKPASSTSKTTALNRSVPMSTAVGRNPITVKKELFGNVDYEQGFAKSASYEIDKDDRMNARDAWVLMQQVLGAYGLANATEEHMFTFMRAMFAYHAVNSGSTLQPARSKIRCLGNVFDSLPMLQILGNDIRRFFRAYADEVRKEVQRILKAPMSSPMWEIRGWVMDVAFERGLQRYPDLIADSSDACSNLSHAEKAAQAASKRFVISTNVNTVDSMIASGRSQGADKFDSTAGTSVHHAEGEAPSRRG